MNISIAVAGIVLLVFGRKLLWLLVGAAGFLVGYHAAGMLSDTVHQPTALAGGIVLGLAGALLALFAQKVAILIGGFLAGGFVVMKLASGMGIPDFIPGWIPFAAGGLLGGLLMKGIFEWALIILTSLLGAVMIVSGVDLSQEAGFIFTLLLAVVGIIVQGRSRAKKNS